MGTQVDVAQDSGMFAPVAPLGISAPSNSTAPAFHTSAWDWNCGGPWSKRAKLES
jgi:hypothetical protein